MRGKKAKALRRISEAGSVGYPAVDFVKHFEKESRPPDPWKYRVEHADRTTRGLYRILKKAAKRTV